MVVFTITYLPKIFIPQGPKIERKLFQSASINIYAP
jgi:hypothetical protein